MRVEVGLDPEHGVEEVGLVEHLPHRLGLVDRRRIEHTDAGRAAKQLDRRAQVGQAVAFVRAQAEVGRAGARRRAALAQRETSTDTSSTATGSGGSGFVALTTTPAAPKRSTSESAIAVQRRSRVRYERSVAMKVTESQTAP